MLFSEKESSEIIKKILGINLEGINLPGCKAHLSQYNVISAPDKCFGYWNDTTDMTARKEFTVFGIVIQIFYQEV